AGVRPTVATSRAMRRVWPPPQDRAPAPLVPAPAPATPPPARPPVLRRPGSPSWPGTYPIRAKLYLGPSRNRFRTVITRSGLSAVVDGRAPGHPPDGPEDLSTCPVNAVTTTAISDA